MMKEIRLVCVILLFSEMPDPRSILPPLQDVLKRMSSLVIPLLRPDVHPSSFLKITCYSAIIGRLERTDR